MVVAPLVLVVLFAGCDNSATTSIRDRRGPAVLTVQGDWDDVDAAVETGVAQAEAAVVRSQTAPDGSQRRYELRHVSGVVGVLNARVDSEGKDPRPIALSCTMGAMENQGMAQRIIDRVARRLTDLTGREVAPIRE